MIVTGLLSIALGIWIWRRMTRRSPDLEAAHRNIDVDLIKMLETCIVMKSKQIEIQQQLIKGLQLQAADRLEAIELLTATAADAVNREKRALAAVEAVLKSYAVPAKEVQKVLSQIENSHGTIDGSAA